MVGKPKHGTTKGHRVKALLESPRQGREVNRGLESLVTGRAAGLVCVDVSAWAAPHSQAFLLMEWPPRPVHKCPLPTSLPTPVSPYLAPALGATLHLPPRGGQGTPLPPPGQGSLAQNGSLQVPTPLPLPPLPQNFLAVGIAAELSSVSVVPGCQRLYISALLMLILCNHFLLQNLLAAR